MMHGNVVQSHGLELVAPHGGFGLHDSSTIASSSKRLYRYVPSWQGAVLAPPREKLHVMLIVIRSGVRGSCGPVADPCLDDHFL